MTAMPNTHMLMTKDTSAPRKPVSLVKSPALLARPAELGVPNRDRFLAEYGAVWGLVGDYQRTRMQWKGLAHLLRHARAVVDRGVPGGYAEFGTWRCGSLYAVARAWERFAAVDRPLLGFDSFEGLPAPVERVDGPWLHRGVFGDVDFDEVRDFFEREGLADRVTLVRGWFDQTAARVREHRLSLLHVDADLYESVKTALEAAWDSLVPGGIAVFDDYRHPDCAGCTIAVEEFFASRSEVIRTQAGMNYSAYVVKNDPATTMIAFSLQGSRTKWCHEEQVQATAHESSEPSLPVSPLIASSRLIERCAAWCAREGYRRIALFGAGRHTRPITRQPWATFGVRVVAIVDDSPRTDSIGGVPVCRPEALAEPVDAVVVSSECYESTLAERARAVFEPRVPVVRIYADEPPPCDALLRIEGISPEDAAWLLALPPERADPTLPVVASVTSEMMLRRYELASAFARDARVLDIPCGTGYGSKLLLGQGHAAAYIGIDADERTIRYAQRRFDGPRRTFAARDPIATRLERGSIDVAIAAIDIKADPVALAGELARVLRPGGVLLMHADFNSISDDPASRLARALAGAFEADQWLGQCGSDVTARPDLPPGVFHLGDERAEWVIVVARRV